VNDRVVMGVHSRRCAHCPDPPLYEGRVCSLGVSLLIRDLLFGVQAWDAATLSCVAALLGLASMASSFLPARRAASVNPTDALRAE
jgi:ABC-type lipoprotein release transport system permease subunit